ncbi:MAG: hypothetical protein RL367_1262 [Pseudomonadota bacterium]
MLMNAVAGLLVGIIVGMTGVGGGSLMAPIMILVFGQSPATAVGTDLWFAGITKLVGGTVHHSVGKGIDWRVLRRMCMGSLPAAAITLYILWSNQSSPIKGGVITHALGGVLIMTAIATLFRHKFIAWSRTLQDRRGDHPSRGQLTLTVLSGAVLGVLVMLTSVGAGALGVTMMLCLYPLRLADTKRLVATDIAHAVPLTLLGGMGNLLMGSVPAALQSGDWFIGTVNVTLLGGLLLGSIPGIIIGSVATRWIGETLLRRVLAAVLVAVGLKLLLS